MFFFFQTYFHFNSSRILPISSGYARISLRMPMGFLRNRKDRPPSSKTHFLLYCSISRILSFFYWFE
jgi:hypothetical protein